MVRIEAAESRVLHKIPFRGVEVRAEIKNDRAAGSVPDARNAGHEGRMLDAADGSEEVARNRDKSAGISAAHAGGSPSGFH